MSFIKTTDSSTFWYYNPQLKVMAYATIPKVMGISSRFIDISLSRIVGNTTIGAQTPRTAPYLVSSSESSYGVFYSHSSWKLENTALILCSQCGCDLNQCLYSKVVDHGYEALTVIHSACHGALKCLPGRISSKYGTPWIEKCWMFRQLPNWHVPSAWRMNR